MATTFLWILLACASLVAPASPAVTMTTFQGVRTGISAVFGAGASTFAVAPAAPTELTGCGDSLLMPGGFVIVFDALGMAGIVATVAPVNKMVVT